MNTAEFFRIRGRLPASVICCALACWRRLTKKAAVMNIENPTVSCSHVDCHVSDERSSRINRRTLSRQSGMLYTPRTLRLAHFIAVTNVVSHYLVAHAQLAAGNLIALRVGSGSALSTSASAIFIDELAAGTGSVVQTLNIPSTGTNQCTLSGNIVGEGLLTTSFDGLLASFACYMVASGTANVAAGTSNNRAIINVLPSAAASARVGLGSGPYSNRAVFGAVVMNTAGDWYSTGPAASTRGISYNSAVGSL